MLQTNIYRLFIDTSVHQEPFSALFENNTLVWTSVSSKEDKLLESWEFLEMTYRNVTNYVHRQGKKKFVDYLHFGLGPGSFVGVRAGLSFVQALHCSGHCELSFFSSLDLLFVLDEGKKRMNQQQWAVRDARSGGVYLQRLQDDTALDNAQLSPWPTPEKVTIDVFAKLWLASLRAKSTLTLLCCSSKDRQIIGNRLLESKLLPERAMCLWFEDHEKFPKINLAQRCLNLNLYSTLEARPQIPGSESEEICSFPFGVDDDRFLNPPVIEPLYLQSQSHYRQLAGKPPSLGVG